MPRERKTVPWLKVRDGVHYVYWYDPEAAGEDAEGRAKGRTKRISLATKDPVEARSRYAAFLSGGNEIFGPRRDDRRIDVGTALDQYRQEHVSKEVVDRARAEGIIVLLKRWFKDTPVEEIDIPACRAYADARMDGTLIAPKKEDGSGRGGRAVSESTARREIGILNAAVEHAARWKRIGPKARPPTPMPSIELPAGGKPRLVFLTNEELAVVVNSAEGRLKEFIQVLYYTAARRRSVERLVRYQVDLRAGTINLTSPLETENERNSKKRRPVVPIHAKIRPIIERLYTASVAANVEWLWGDDKDMYTAFSDHLIRLGLADKAFPHVLRHSRASHLLQAGVPIAHVAKLLGDTIATVDRVYGKMAPDDVADAIAESGI